MGTVINSGKLMIKKSRNHLYTFIVNIFTFIDIKIHVHKLLRLKIIRKNTLLIVLCLLLYSEINNFICFSNSLYL